MDLDVATTQPRRRRRGRRAARPDRRQLRHRRDAVGRRPARADRPRRRPGRRRPGLRDRVGLRPAPLQPAGAVGPPRRRRALRGGKAPPPRRAGSASTPSATSTSGTPTSTSTSPARPASSSSGSTGCTRPSDRGPSRSRRLGSPPAPARREPAACQTSGAATWPTTWSSATARWSTARGRRPTGPTSACATGASPRSGGSASGAPRRSTPRATSSRPASSTATPTWTPRCSGTRWAPARAGTASPRWSWATAGSPSRPPGPTQRHLVVRNLERAEDISADAMAAGIDWTWETFPEYLDAVDRAPKGINYAAQHRPLGAAHLGDGRAGVRPTSRQRGRPRGDGARAARRAAGRRHRLHHLPHAEPRDLRRPAGRVPAGRRGTRCAALVGVMGDARHRHVRDRPGAGGAGTRRRASAPSSSAAWRDLAVETGVPFTFGVLSATKDGHDWRDQLELIDAHGAAGGRMFGQAHCREISVLLSFKTRLPFDVLPEWKERRAPCPWTSRPGRCATPSPAGQARRRRPPRRLRPGHRRRDPQARLRLAAHPRPAVAAQPHRGRAWPSGQGKDPVELMIDLALERTSSSSSSRSSPTATPTTCYAIMTPPPHGHDVLRLGRARQPDHGLLDPDPPARPLGARPPGVHARGGRAHADPRAGDGVGLRRPGARARGLRGRPQRVRPGDGRPRPARPSRPTCPPAPAASSRPRPASWPRSSAARWCCATASTPAPCPVSCCGARWPAERERAGGSAGPATESP